MPAVGPVRLRVLPRPVSWSCGPGSWRVSCSDRQSSDWRSGCSRSLPLGRPSQVRALPARRATASSPSPTTATSGWPTPTARNPVRLTAHVSREHLPALLARREVDRLHQQPHGERRRVGDPGGRRRSAPADVPHDRRHGPLLDAGRQAHHLREQPQRSAPFGSPLYSVALEGGLPEPLPIDVGQQRHDQAGWSRWSPSTAFGVRYWRKGYKGNAADDIFVQDLKTKKITQLTDTEPAGVPRRSGQSLYPMWGADGMIYFSSERDGIFNIWKIAPSGGEPAQVTRHKKDGVQFPSISPDGKTIAYENEFELWTLDVPGGTPKKVALDLAFDPKENLIRYVTSKGNADGFAPVARRRLRRRRLPRRDLHRADRPGDRREAPGHLVLVARPPRALLAERPLHRLHLRRVEGRGGLGLRPADRRPPEAQRRTPSFKEHRRLVARLEAARLRRRQPAVRRRRRRRRRSPSWRSNRRAATRLSGYLARRQVARLHAPRRRQNADVYLLRHRGEEGSTTSRPNPFTDSRGVVHAGRQARRLPLRPRRRRRAAVRRPARPAGARTRTIRS